MALEWNQKGSLKGPQGDTGPQGAKGDPGASVRTASIDIADNSDVSVDVISPSTGIRAGDLLMDVQGSVYAVASVAEGGGTVHVGTASDVSLMGPQGPTGPAGKDGTGVNILGGYDSFEELQEAHPSGDAGDAYLVDGDLYVWNGSLWQNVGNIQGPKGDTGATGSTGAKGDTGAVGATGAVGPGVSVGSGSPTQPGTAGECYIDVDTGNLYRFEETEG